MKLDMRDIEYFVVVAERGHIGRAAEQLGLSQPAVSKSLRRLERSIGTRLVKRTPKGVDLTAVGTALISRARGLQVSLDAFARAAVDLGHGHVGHLRVGVGAGFAEHLLAPACSSLLKEARKLTVAVTVDNNVGLKLALRRGEFDLFVGPIPPTSEESMVHEHLYDDEFVIYASARHPLAGRRRVTLADLAQERFVSPSAHAPAWQALHRAFEERGFGPPQIALEAVSLAVRLPVVASSDLLGFSSKPVVAQAQSRYRLAILQLKEWSWRRRVGLTYRENTYFPPAALRFIEILKSTARQVTNART